MTFKLLNSTSRTTLLIAALSLGLVTTLSACKAGTETDTGTQTAAKTLTAKSSALSIPFEKYTLDNGLDVVLHVDRSDPIVAINIAAHVGSGRETKGRTGFAHLFEHLLFLDSENLGYGGLDEMNTRIGGEGTNGFTTHDMTQYFQAVPSDALEKVIWAEADKLGWFINTVSQNVIDKEKQVVKNEKRQRVDNAPYGHDFFVINKALYPEDHPYNWQVIGSLADLDAATLEDTKNFYKRWYVPNNVTLTITGDLDIAQTKKWVEKYFGEIPRGQAVEDFTPRAGVLETSKSFYHEDNFAKVPQLTMVWPAVEQYHPDSYALNILARYLTSGKRAPLNEVLVDEEKLTSDVSAFYYGKEVSGEFYIFASTNEGEDIDGLIEPMARAFARFEENGISQADLDRIKTGLEVSYYDDVQSVLGKAIKLSEYNLFSDDPGFYKTDLARIQGVTTDDVVRVYNQYIRNKNRIYTSFVPKGELDLKLDTVLSPIKADVVEEVVIEGQEATVDFDPAARVLDSVTPSAFDRTVEPQFGKAYTLPAPVVWTEDLGNGMKIYGSEADEIPLVYFNLKLDAGRNRGDVTKPSVPALTADLMEKGTLNKSTAELEDAIKSLGSSISIGVGSDSTQISGSTLARNFDATLALVQEMLSEPRWDAEEFELLKSKTLQNLTQSEGNPNAISSRESAKLRYPETHMFHYPSYGTKETLEAVTLDDLKAFYANNYALNNSSFRIVGDMPQKEIVKAVKSLTKAWIEIAPQAAELTRAPLSLPQSAPIDTAKIYFYDIPESKQSVLNIQRPSLSAVDPDYPLARAINFPLGGIYTSKLMSELRVNKGYTYGIRSGFSGSADRGTFSVRSSVRTNVTKESIEIIRDIIKRYGPEFTQDDLDVMKAALLRGQALKNETLSDKLGTVQDISGYGYPANYAELNAARISKMTLADFKALAVKYLRPDAMNYVIVGDAKTQASGLESLGLGTPIVLNPDE